MGKLSEVEIYEELKLLPDWKRIDDKWIERKYRFLDYLNGIEFVKQVANLSENKNHHPFISIDYKLITLKLTSWHDKGLTALDFELGKMYDELFLKIKAKS